MVLGLIRAAVRRVERRVLRQAGLLDEPSLGGASPGRLWARCIGSLSERLMGFEKGNGLGVVPLLPDAS